MEQNNSLATTGKELTTRASQSLQIKALGKELLSYNLLTAFPLSDGLLKAYAEKLIELGPGIKTKDVHTAINGLILGRMDYDKALGIQNVINALYVVYEAKRRLYHMKTRAATNKHEYDTIVNNYVEPSENEVLAEIERHKKKILTTRFI